MPPSNSIPLKPPPDPKRGHRRRLFWGIYAAGLALSYGTRAIRSDPPPPPQARKVQAVDAAGEFSPQDVSVHDIRWGGESNPDQTPVILLHGSPGNSGDFRSLGPILGRNRPTYALDLPGFGRSDRRIPTYSNLAHAHYVLQWMDRRDLRAAHVLGFSMGGGVALRLADLAPQRVHSVALVSSIGVQEWEWTGNYAANHAIHLLQWLSLAGIRNGFPHFGAYDDAFLSVEFARNFLDTDQRPLRGILQTMQQPIFILHGAQDFLVPAAAAREHARIAPHSEFVLWDTNHFFIFRGGARVAEVYEPFLNRVEQGNARTREQAEAERIQASARPFDPLAYPPTETNRNAMVGLLALSTLLEPVRGGFRAGQVAKDGLCSLPQAFLGTFVGSIGNSLLLLLSAWLLIRPWWLWRRPSPAPYPQTLPTLVTRSIPFAGEMWLLFAAGTKLWCRRWLLSIIAACVISSFLSVAVGRIL